MLDQVLQDLLPGQQRDADLLDLQPPRDVPERRGLVVVGPGGQAEADDRQDHVARPGDVVHLAGAGRHDLAPAIGADQGHPVAVERHQDRVHPELLDQRPPHLDRLVGRPDRPPRRQPRFEPVGRHAVDPGVPGVVRPPDRVGHDRNALLAAGGDQGPEELRGADPLVVVRDQDEVGPGHRVGQAPDQLGLDGERQRVAGLVVDPDHLLRVAVLRPADVPLLERGRPVVEGDHVGMVDRQVVEDLPDMPRLGVAADPADQADLRPEGREHRRHARRPAEAVLAGVGPEQGDGRLLADPLGVAPDVAVQDQVADDQQPGTAQRFDATDQIKGHARGPP